MLQRIEKNLIIAERNPKGSGYTWTLASRLGEMLHMAEYLFGPRDCSYTLLGIEFACDGPQIWYPENRKHIIIQLNCSAATDVAEAYYQMAHETVHLLAPTGGRHGTTNLEEGIACYFADYYMTAKKIDRPKWAECRPRNYMCALEAVTPLLDEDIYCVRRLREHQCSFRDMTKEDIIKVFPNLESKDVDFLIEKFDKNSDG